MNNKSENLESFIAKNIVHPLFKPVVIYTTFAAVFIVNIIHFIGVNPFYMIKLCRYSTDNYSVYMYSGFITDIGFETYHRILNEAILELKESSFQELLEEEQNIEIEKQITQQRFIKDCQIDTDLELLFPDNYINNISERIRLYRELDNIDTEEKLIDFENQLKDRFGTVPVQTIELMNIVRLRWLAINLGFEKIIIKNERMVAHFMSNQDSPYYKSEVFLRILNFVQQNPENIKMKETNNKLTMSFVSTNSVKQAIQLIEII